MGIARDTIFATGTAPGRAAIAVIRISGAASFAAVSALTATLVRPDRVMRLRALRDPCTGETVDQALIVGFPESSSPTGEQYAELHVHGGIAVSASVLRILGALPEMRLAEPGEFSRRALENGKVDLTQIEGVADLVAAETEAQRRQAVRLLQGDLASQVLVWRDTLIKARAFVEASVDFADDDVPETLIAEAIKPLLELSQEIRRELRGVTAGEIVRNGFEIAIVGSPNVGKSSLINKLGSRNIALTSPHPGTTRDVIELRCVVNGYLVIFLDTAGLRETDDPVEQAGVDLARRRAAEANLRIVVWAPGCGQHPLPGPNDILVWNKADLSSGPGINVSAMCGTGLTALMGEVTARLARMTCEADIVVRTRHRAMLEDACRHLERAALLESDVELAAEELRLATAALDKLIGRVDCDEVLSSIFSQLCIGK